MKQIKHSTALLLAAVLLVTFALPLASVFTGLTVSAAAPDADYTVSSPDGTTHLAIDLSSDGSLTYFAVQDGVTVVKTSDMGIKTSLGDFTKGLTFVSVTSREIRESYSVISGKQS